MAAALLNILNKLLLIIAYFTMVVISFNDRITSENDVDLLNTTNVSKILKLTFLHGKLSNHYKVTPNKKQIKIVSKADILSHMKNEKLVKKTAFRPSGTSNEHKSHKPKISKQSPKSLKQIAIKKKAKTTVSSTVWTPDMCPNDSRINIKAIERLSPEIRRVSANYCPHQTKVIFMIPTAPKNTHCRTYIRQFYGTTFVRSVLRWWFVFFIGLSEHNQYIIQEAREHGDIVILPFKDSYWNLTYKTTYGSLWVVENCRKVEFVVKVDDDIFFNPVIVSFYVRNILAISPNTLHCTINVDLDVRRDKWSKYCVRREVYPHSVYRPYCSGWFYMMKRRTLVKLVNMAFRMPYAYNMEDAFFTGDVARLAFVKRTSFEAWLDSFYSESTVKNMTHVASHRMYYTPYHGIRAMYEYMNELLHFYHFKTYHELLELAALFQGTSDDEDIPTINVD